MKYVKRVLLLLFAVALVGGLVYAFQPAPIAVDVAEVRRGPLRVTVDEDGRTRVKDRYVVSSPVTGRMLRVLLKPGDVVEKDRTLLATLEPTDPILLDVRSRAEAAARVEVAMARKEHVASKVERARVTDDFAREDFTRARRLLQTNGISRQDYDNIALKAETAAEELRTAKFEEVVADYEIKQNRAALIRAHQNGGHSLPSDSVMSFVWDQLQTEAVSLGRNGACDLRSPIDGKVLRVLQESTGTVTPGLKILEVGDPQQLEIEVDVLSTQAVKIRPGARMILEHWGGEQPLEAQVRLIEPSGFLKVSALGVEEQRVNVIADFQTPVAERKSLGDGFRVEARIVVWENADVVKVPAGALFPHKSGKAVFVMEGDKAVLRRVKTDHNNGLEAEILDGVKPGEKVVVHPSDRIKDGTAIVPREEN